MRAYLFAIHCIQMRRQPSRIVTFRVEQELLFRNAALDRAGRHLSLGASEARIADCASRQRTFTSSRPRFALYAGRTRERFKRWMTGGPSGHLERTCDHSSPEREPGGRREHGQHLPTEKLKEVVDQVLRERSPTSRKLPERKGDRSAPLAASNAVFRSRHGLDASDSRRPPPT